MRWSRISYELRIALSVMGPMALGLVLLMVAGRLYDGYLTARWRPTVVAIAASLDPLVESLRQIKAETGAYPEVLPPQANARLEAVPHVRRVWYRAQPGGAECDLNLIFPGTFHGLGHFGTSLVWRSDQRYPRLGYGGVLSERIGAWAVYPE